MEATAVLYYVLTPAGNTVAGPLGVLPIGATPTKTLVATREMTVTQRLVVMGLALDFFRSRRGCELWQRGYEVAKCMDGSL